MKKYRIAAIAGIVVLLGVVGWLFMEINRAQQAMTDQTFGVAFSLTGQDGKPVTEKILRGKPTLLYFGFTHCPEICPTTLFEMDGWLKAVDPDGDKVHAFFVTVDPERDTPELMGQYVSNVSDRIFGIGGNPAEVARVLKGYRVYARKVPSSDGEYTMDHTAAVFLLDGKGHFRGTISYGENTDSALAKIRKLMADG